MGMVLEGIRVVEVATFYAGPGASMYLADLGADVTKVEPIEGDGSRRLHTSPRLGLMSKPYLVLNRNKRSIALDLRKPRGREVLHRLVDSADVFIHNFPLGQPEKFGVDYPTLSGRNPRLVYAHVTAYGTRGPYAAAPGYDIAIQARAGITGARRMPDGTPVTSPVLLADMSAPMLLAFGITAALLDRHRTGRGRLLTTSLLDLLIAMQAYQLVKVEGEPGALPGTQPNALYSPYRCADDKWLVIAVITDAKWAKLCQVLGLEHLAREPAFATYMKRLETTPQIGAILQAVFATRPREEWLAALEAAEVPGCPVNDREDVFHDPQVLANETIVAHDHPAVGRVWFMNTPIQISGQERGVRIPSPRLGEHTDPILAEAGYSETDISALREEKVVA